MKSTQEPSFPTTATAAPPQSTAVLLPSLAPAPAVAQIPVVATQTLSPDEARRARRRVAGDARKRIANACLACKSRKQKCDGKQPCNICRRRGADCIYVEQPPRQPKRRPQSSSVAGSTHVIAGDGTSKRTNPTKSPSPGGHRRSHPNHSNVQPPDWGHSFPGADPVNIHTLRSQKTDDLRQRAAESQTGSGESADTDNGRMAVDRRTLMLPDPRGRLIYIGETASSSFLARLRKVARDTLGQSAFASDSLQNSIADRPSIPRLHRNPDIPPVFESASPLIDLYFTNVHPIHYVLDREEMDQIMAAVYSGTATSTTTGDRGKDIRIVNAVCALGTFFTQQPQASAESGMQYFDTARTMVEDVFESADFWSVRLILLCALYMQYAAKRNACWTYVGLGIRIGETIGLHRVAQEEHGGRPANGDRNPERRRRLVFWTLYSLDRFTACSLGRPLGVSDENCDDPVFSLLQTDDFLAGTRCCSADQHESLHRIHQYAAKVRLHLIVGHIVKLVYLKRSICGDVAESLSNELKLWWRSLPPCAALANHGTDPAVVQLHMTYLHAVTLLTRPFLQRVVEASVEESTRSGSCQCQRRTSNVKREMLRYAKACVLVAERTVALAHRLRKSGTLHRNDATLIYYLFTAGLVLLFSIIPQIIRHRDDHGGAEDDSNSAEIRAYSSSSAVISLMAECAAVETCTAKQYHNALKHFATALAEGRERRQRGQQEARSRERGPSATEDLLPEADLLDELQATGTEYFAGAYSSRLASTESACRESVAAHALVAVALDGQHPEQLVSPQQHVHAEKEQMPGFEGAPGVVAKGDEEAWASIFRPTDFSSFFPWLEDGLAESSPAVPWELSWDGPPSNYFLHAHTTGTNPENTSMME